MVALTRCLGSLALFLAGTCGARVSKKHASTTAPITKFIAGVPVRSYHIAYGGKASLGELEAKEEQEWVVAKDSGPWDLVAHPGAGCIGTCEGSGVNWGHMTLDECKATCASNPRCKYIAYGGTHGSHCSWQFSDACEILGYNNFNWGYSLYRSSGVKVQNVRVCVVVRAALEGNGDPESFYELKTKTGSEWSRERRVEQSFSINAQVSARTEGLAWSADASIQSSFSRCVQSASVQSGFSWEEETIHVRMSEPCYVYQGTASILLDDGTVIESSGFFKQTTAPLQPDKWCYDA